MKAIHRRQFLATLIAVPLATILKPVRHELEIMKAGSSFTDCKISSGTFQLSQFSQVHAGGIVTTRPIPWDATLQEIGRALEEAKMQGIILCPLGRKAL